MSESDPLVMYIVVNTDVALAFEDLAQHLVTATMRCARDLRMYDATKALESAFVEWETGLYRKVVLRASGNAFLALCDLPQSRAETSVDITVRVFPPQRRSERRKDLKRLQVYSEALTPFTGELVPDGAMAIVLNPNATMRASNPNAAMSAGKALVQIAHAALLCAVKSGVDVSAWAAARYPCAFLAGEHSSAMREVPGAVVVVDAGLTELEPGTETALALPPV